MTESSDLAKWVGEAIPRCGWRIVLAPHEWCPEEIGAIWRPEAGRMLCGRHARLWEARICNLRVWPDYFRRCSGARAHCGARSKWNMPNEFGVTRGFCDACLGQMLGEGRE